MRFPRIALPIITLAGTLASGGAQAQGIAFEAARIIGSPDWSAYRLAYTQRLIGPVGGTLYGTYLIPRSASDLSLYGVGASLTLFQGGEPGLYFLPTLSPDGTRVAVVREDPEAEQTDIWSIDVATGRAVQVTDDAAGEVDPIFSPDGRQILYVSLRPGGRAGIYRKHEAGDVQ